MTDKYDAFINKYCLNRLSTTSATGEMQWLRKCREELLNLMPIGFIERKLACPDCGPRLKKGYAAFKKEARRELKKEREANP